MHRLVEGVPPRPLREVLPQHTRPARDFQATFGRSAEHALAGMNEAGDDVPNQSPLHPLALARVGLTRTSVPIVIANPFGTPGTVHVACTVDAHVGLAPDKRGIHVSRIGHVLAELAGQPHASLHAYAVSLCERVAEVQQCGTAEVAVSGVLSYVEHVGGVSQRASIEHLTLSAEARHRDGRTEAGHGIAFNHITACPCVQQTYRHAVAVPDGVGTSAADARRPWRHTPNAVTHGSPSIRAPRRFHSTACSPPSTASSCAARTRCRATSSSLPWITPIASRSSWRTSCGTCSRPCTS